MSFRAPVTIDRTHSSAICEEIGYRLRIALLRKSPELPMHLRRLLERFRALECEDAPSLIPSTNDLLKRIEPVGLLVENYL
jgi:hypothetical protein